MRMILILISTDTATATAVATAIVTNLNRKSMERWWRDGKGFFLVF